MLRLLALAKKHLFPKAHATAAIKCEGATVKSATQQSAPPVFKPDHTTKTSLPISRSNT